MDDDVNVDEDSYMFLPSFLAIYHTEGSYGTSWQLPITSYLKVRRIRSSDPALQSVTIMYVVQKDTAETVKPKY
jgi:hypothetical protein